MLLLLSFRDGVRFRDPLLSDDERELFENGEDIIIVRDRDTRLDGARGPPGTVGLARGIADGGFLVSLAGEGVGIVGCLSLLLILAFLPKEAKKFPALEGRKEDGGVMLPLT